jgi:hypothetical protein
MKIEAGKYYKTRDGRKAYVAAVLENPLGRTVTHKCLGFVGDRYMSWTDNGHEWSCFGGNPSDLIAEWREPREWTVSIVDVGDGTYCTTVHPHFGGKVLARVVVREGEGVE